MTSNRCTTAEGRARRIGFALLAVLALTLLPATPASAISWADEDQMVDSHDGRGTFVADPGRTQRWKRAQLIAAHGAYYTDRDMGNVLAWGTADSGYDPKTGARWAGCGSAGQLVPNVYCPDLDTLHWGLVAAALTSDDTISVIRSGDAFVALACGNFSEQRTTIKPPRITGAKFEDVDGDGRRDPGEPGLAGWTIKLHNGGDVIAMTQTDGNGHYAFTLDADTLPITSENFQLSESMQGDWVQSVAPETVHVAFGPGSVDKQFPGNDFGNYRPATIAGVKYEDMDADGGRDAGDPLLGDWTIDLSRSGTATQTDITDAGGVYAFGGLRPGTYSVAERLQDGWRHSSPATGESTITVISGERATVEFGNYRPATIAGAKFDDHDVDRVRDDGDEGVPGWTIGLSGGPSDDATLLTGEDGSYTFDGLIPGTYVVAETQRDGWRQSAPESGTHTVTVRSSEAGLAVFGNVCLGTADVNITDEDSGAPLHGVEVRIEEVAVPGVLTNEPTLPRSTTGSPLFGDLLPGTYRVTAFLPATVYTTDPRVTVVDGRLAVVAEMIVPECGTEVVEIKMFTTSTGKVTGGMKMQVPGGFATAGFVFMTRKGTPEGSLEYQDHATGLNLHSTAIEQIHVHANQAWVGGLVEIGGVTYRFALHLVDNGEPGRDDRFHLIVENGYEAGASSTIEDGNVQVHRAKPGT